MRPRYRQPAGRQRASAVGSEDLPSAALIAQRSLTAECGGTAQGGFRTEGDTVGTQHVAHIQDEREHLAVPVLALLIPGPLLRFDRHPVLGEYALREAPDKRPREVDGAWDRRLLDHEQAVDMIGPLLGVFRHVGHPQGKRW